MENLLTKEEVLKVASLAKIKITDEEKLEKYQKQLKILIDSIDKIKDIELITNEIMISSINHKARLSDDIVKNQIDFDNIKHNIPKVKGNFIEVPVMINE